MKQVLRISDTVNLPANGVTQTFACIGRKGAGKTYLASMLAEQMLDIGAQIVIIDPVGNWWGLRVDADGKSKGKDIFIAGGERGDVPVLPEAGARFARLVVEKNVSMILDVSGFRQGERKRFAADFAEEFFHLKKTQRSAVHLFVEEAQLFVPQRCGPEEARMLGAFENIIRLGRNYGIGATLISQRPQSVNKEVLSQVECLCVLQVNGSHERKALEEWVQEAGADRKLVGELPGLSQGEGYVWSPSWLRVFEKVRFAKKVTFDASATPEVGKATRAALLTKVDVEALKADLQSVIQSAEKDDPKVLRKKIAELERAAQQQAKQQPSSASDHNEELSILRQQVRDLSSRLTEARRRAESVHGLVDTKFWPQVEKLKETWVDVTTAMGQIRAATDVDVSVSSLPIPISARVGVRQSFVRSQPRPAAKAESNGSGDINGPQLKILNAIATFVAANVPARATHIAGFCGTTARSRGFEENLRYLRNAGVISTADGALLDLSGRGTPETMENGMGALRSVLSDPQFKMLEAVRDTPGVDAESLAEYMGTTVRARGFEENLRRLRNDDLLVGSKESLKVAEWLR